MNRNIGLVRLKLLILTKLDRKMLTCVDRSKSECICICVNDNPFAEEISVRLHSKDETE